MSVLDRIKLEEVPTETKTILQGNLSVKIVWALSIISKVLLVTDESTRLGSIKSPFLSLVFIQSRSSREHRSFLIQRLSLQLQCKFQLFSCSECASCILWVLVESELIENEWFDLQAWLSSISYFLIFYQEGNWIRRQVNSVVYSLRQSFSKLWSICTASVCEIV